jgi:hypothetical protein
MGLTKLPRGRPFIIFKHLFPSCNGLTFSNFFTNYRVLLYFIIFLNNPNNFPRLRLLKQPIRSVEIAHLVPLKLWPTKPRADKQVYMLASIPKRRFINHI